jgi:hypothetical protein
MEIVSKISRMKIIFLLLAFPFSVNAQYTNLLRDKEIFNSTSINYTIAEKDSIVFTGLRDIFDSTNNLFYNTYFIGKLATNETNNFRLIDINFENNKYLLKPIKIFQKHFGYSIIFKYLKRVDTTIGECGYFLMNYNNSLEFIDSSKIVFKESNIVMDSTGEFGIYDLFSEVIINSQNHYVFTILYRKKTFFTGNYEIGNSILEITEEGKLVKNKVIEYVYNAPQTNSNITLTPIVTLEEINWNDSIKYIGFNGNYQGGQVYLDSLFNIKKVTNFLISFPIKTSEFKFQTYFVKSIKRNNTVYVAGPGDSIVVEDGGAKDYIPCLLIKKIVNNQTLSTLCIKTQISYSFYDDLKFENWFQNDFLIVNSKNEILITMIISSRYTYMAMLDSNLNLIWEKYLDSKSPFVTGYLGATTTFNNNGFYIHGYSCNFCVIDSKVTQHKGFIGYVGNNGNLLGIKKSATLKDEKIKVFPNPATAFLIIEAEAPINEISIFNIEGKEVFKLKSRDLTKKFNLNLEENKIIKGLYIIHVVTENETFFKKLIVDN